MATLHGISTEGEQDQHLHLQPCTRQIQKRSFQQLRPGLPNGAANDVNKAEQIDPAYFMMARHHENADHDVRKGDKK